MTPSSALSSAANGGSWRIRFVLYRMSRQPRKGLRGKIDRIRVLRAKPVLDDPTRNQQYKLGNGECDRRLVAGFLVEWFDEQIGRSLIKAAGHRVANCGAEYRERHRITQEVLAELRGVSAYAPEHLRFESDLLDMVHEQMPSLPHVACFDTALQLEVPRVARIPPIPRRFATKGVDATQGCVTLCHLRNGASLATLCDGKSIDTSMGFTPAASVPMSKTISRRVSFVETKM